MCTSNPDGGKRLRVAVGFCILSMMMDMDWSSGDFV